MSLSSEDAKRDNIRSTLEGGEFRKYTVYHITCDACGNEYTKQIYKSSVEHLCDRCRYMRNRKIKEKTKADLEGFQTKNEIKFEKAIIEMKNHIATPGKFLNDKMIVVRIGLEHSCLSTYKPKPSEQEPSA